MHGPAAPCCELALTRSTRSGNGLKLKLMTAHGEGTKPVKRCASASTFEGITNECTLLDGHFGLHHGGIHQGSEIWWSGNRRVNVDDSDMNERSDRRD